MPAIHMKATSRAVQPSPGPVRAKPALGCRCGPCHGKRDPNGNVAAAPKLKGATQSLLQETEQEESASIPDLRATANNDCTNKKQA